jgi:hypothetical protein
MLDVTHNQESSSAQFYSEKRVNFPGLEKKMEKS